VREDAPAGVTMTTRRYRNAMRRATPARRSALCDDMPCYCDDAAQQSAPARIQQPTMSDDMRGEAARCDVCAQRYARYAAAEAETQLREAYAHPLICRKKTRGPCHARRTMRQRKQLTHFLPTPTSRSLVFTLDQHPLVAHVILPPFARPFRASRAAIIRPATPSYVPNAGGDNGQVTAHRIRLFLFQQR